MAQAGLDWDSFGSFGDLLRFLRLRARLTQRDLAIAVGYSEAQITRLERGQRLPDPVVVQTRFVEALDLTGDPRAAQRLVQLAEQTREDSTRETISSTSSTTPPVTPVKRTNLQAQLTRFIGREREMEEVRRLLSQQRLVTLTGSGGVGKTRLAMEVGLASVGAPEPGAPTHGIWLVELAPLADPALAPKAVAQVFKLVEQPGQTLVEALTDHLRDKRLLLLLDNCEHLIGVCAELAHLLLRECPGIHILATSREPLRVAGEVAWRVPSLQTPDAAHLPETEHLLDYEAVQLFIQHATAAHPGFELTPAHARSIARICHQLDGIPLAIEMAAARVQAMSVGEIAARLDQRFHWLTSGQRTALPRHQTLRATLDWSHDLLTGPERVLLRRLSVFAGGWTAEAAEAVCADPLPLPPGERAGVRGEAVLSLLLSLVDKSLVVAEPRAGHTRYQLLETVRQYAAEKLDEAGEVEKTQTHSRHLDCYLKFAEADGADTGEVIGAGLAETEIDNYRAALAWGLSRSPDDERGLSLALSLESLWTRSYPYEGRAWLDKFLAKRIHPSTMRARSLELAGLMAWMLGDFSSAHNHLVESVEIFRSSGAQYWLADALERLAMVTWSLGGAGLIGLNYLEKADNYLTEALDIARHIRDQLTEAYAIGLLGTNARLACRPADAYPLLEESVKRLQVIPGTTGHCVAISLLAYCEMSAQNWDLARMHFEQCVILARAHHYDSALAQGLAGLGCVVREQGESVLAIRHLEESLALCLQMGILSGPVAPGASYVLIELGRTAHIQGDIARAIQLVNQGSNVCRRAHDRNGLALSLLFLASLCLDQNDPTRGARNYRESLQLSLKTHSKFGLAAGLAGIAAIALCENRPDYAARMCGAAAALGDIKGFANLGLIPLTPTDWLEYDRTMATISARLDDLTLAAAWAEGKAMTVEQAVAYALSTGTNGNP